MTFDSLALGSSLVAGKTYFLNAGLSIGGRDFGYGSFLEVTPEAAGDLTDYEIWERGEYPFIGAFEDDFDNDGVPNGVEHVFGMNPTDKSDAASALKVKVVDGKIQISHDIIAGFSKDEKWKARIGAEYSYTLKSGSWSPTAEPVLVGGVLTASQPLVDARSGEPVSACYLRWKVTSLPSTTP